MTICAITHSRPDGLARLLDGVARLVVPEGVVVDMVVVDNDPAESARPVIESIVGFPFGLRYRVEPTRGIPFARNAAIDAAAESPPDWIVWMDDDECPHPDWLQIVLDVQERWSADVVMGPNDPVFEPGATEWIVESGLLNYDRFETGARYPYFHTRTSGVIHRWASVPPGGFETRMALSGGSDRLFFTRIHRSGGVFVYAGEALMTEYVPASRARLGWMLRRWYRTGVTRSLTLLYLDDPAWPRRLRRVLGGAVMMGKGAVLALVSIPRGRVAVLRRVRLVLLGVGAAAGALGVQYREYATIHGR